MVGFTWGKDKDNNLDEKCVVGARGGWWDWAQALKSLQKDAERDRRKNVRRSTSTHEGLLASTGSPSSSVALDAKVRNSARLV